MRLSLLSYNYAPEPTGIPYFNSAMCAWFARNGWQVTAHAGIPHYPWWKVPEEYARRDYRWGRGDETIDGVRVERVRHYVPSPPPSGLARMRLDASWLVRTFLRALCARRRPHVLIVVAPPFLGGLLGLVLGRLWRIPVAWHVQDLQVDAALDLGMLPARVGRVLLWLERLILERVELVTTISRAMRRRLAAKGATRAPIALFPNWVDVTTMGPTQRPNAFRAEWGVGDDEVVIAYSGNLGRKQGLDVLIAAFARLDLPRVCFVLAGDGAEKTALEELAARLAVPRLRFLPLVPESRLAEFLSAADIHCVPQRRAAADLVMPSKLLNIMAVARPVLVTALPGTDLADEVLAAGCGVVVEPENPAAIADGLRRLAADPALRAAMGPAGRRHVEARFDAASVLPRMAERLARMVARSRGRRAHP